MLENGNPPCCHAYEKELARLHSKYCSLSNDIIRNFDWFDSLLNKRIPNTQKFVHSRKNWVEYECQNLPPDWCFSDKEDREH